MGCGLEKVLPLFKNLLNDPGRKANEKERQAALRVAEDFISRMRYAPNTQVRRFPVLQAPSSAGSSHGLLLLILDKKGRKASGKGRNRQASLPDPLSGERSSSHSFKILKYMLFSKRLWGSTPLGAQEPDVPLDSLCAFSGPLSLAGIAPLHASIVTPHSKGY